MRRPRIQIVLDETDLTDDVTCAVSLLDAEVDVTPFLAAPSNASRSEIEPLHEARLLLTGNPGGVTNGKLERLLRWVDADPCATLILSKTSSGIPDRPESLGDRPIEFAAALSRDALFGRLSAMCGFAGRLESMRREIEVLRRREQQEQATLSRLSMQLSDAKRLQRELLPPSVPVVEDFDIQVVYQPAEEVGGDLYDFTRISDDRVALALTDATGHGLSAAMLSAFVRPMLQPKSGDEDAASRHSPERVLSRLNKNLLRHPLPSCEFTAALYAVFEPSTGTLRWARAGAPYPVYFPEGDRPRRICSEGPLAGICPQARYDVVELTLMPGDAVLFFTDGLEQALDRRETLRQGERMQSTDWMESLRGIRRAGGMDELRDRLVREREALRLQDDVTAILVAAK